MNTKIEERYQGERLDEDAIDFEHDADGSMVVTTHLGNRYRVRWPVKFRNGVAVPPEAHGATSSN
ncbi:MAG: hypothetical protein ING59_12565 [Burkholderiales bacterium]|nr:hypothetical protein [Burkholderiales bacterium]